MGSVVVFDKTSGTITRHTDAQGGTNDIAYPGPLVKASNGKIYGLAGGGYYGFGTFFEYNPATGTNTILRHFPQNNGPTLGSMFDYNGQLYYFKAGQIQTYNYTTNTFSNLFDFQGGYALSSPTGEMVRVGGKFYGVCAAGGGSSNGGLFSYDPSTNTFVELMNNFSVANGNSTSGGMTLAPNGKLYGILRSGGANNIGIIFEYDIATSAYSIKQSFQTAQGANPNGPLCLASNGLMYGTCQIGGSSNRGSLFEYNPANNSLNIRWNFGIEENTDQTQIDRSLAKLDNLCLLPLKHKIRNNIKISIDAR